MDPKNTNIKYSSTATAGNNEKPTNRIRKKFEIEVAKESTEAPKTSFIERQPAKKRIFEEIDLAEEDGFVGEFKSYFSKMECDLKSRREAKKSRLHKVFQGIKESQMRIIQGTVALEKDRKRETTYLTSGLSELIGNLNTVLKVQTENADTMVDFMKRIVKSQAQVTVTTDATIKALTGLLGRFVATMETIQQQRAINLKEGIDQYNNELETLLKAILEEG